MTTSLLTLAEAKAQLGMTSTANDVELQAYCDSAAAIVERYVGPIDQRTITETTDRECTALLALGTLPAVSVESVASIYSWGPTWTGADLLVDLEHGAVRLANGLHFWSGPFTLTYTAGRASIPPALNLAGRMLVQHLWKSQRGGAKRPGLGLGDDANQVPSYGFELPGRVVVLLEPFLQPGGFA